MQRKKRCKCIQIAGSKRKEWIRPGREDAQQKKKKKVCVRWGRGEFTFTKQPFRSDCVFKYFSAITPEMKLKGSKGSC